MRKMNFSYQTVLASALLASLPLVQAAEDGPFEFSANVALTSDYVWRGMSQNDEGWAIQGGFDITHETGFTLGTWASNVKLLEGDTVKPEDRADIEVDFYLVMKVKQTMAIAMASKPVVIPILVLVAI